MKTENYDKNLNILNVMNEWVKANFTKASIEIASNTVVYNVPQGKICVALANGEIGLGCDFGTIVSPRADEHTLKLFKKIMDSCATLDVYDNYIIELSELKLKPSTLSLELFNDVNAIQKLDEGDGRLITALDSADVAIQTSLERCRNLRDTASRTLSGIFNSIPGDGYKIAPAKHIKRS
ncbi:hypothetical protein HNP86_001990 [Methanococcus maripaludis]|uniref:Uncharacterized protein n=1 Tax=Methanococcus maripaludis TaxID=39152 RepID=A0A7J9NX07_METMI|nr:hypothetical protein [Methanococcus maripaludis]MBA2851831.1 hypothetical protein [Methanococcus maripaludis]